MDFDINAKDVHEATEALKNEGFIVNWHRAFDHVEFVINKGTKYARKKWYGDISVKQFCKDIIKDWKKAHYTIDDISNVEDLQDFCKWNHYVVSISSPYGEPSKYTVSLFGDEFVRNVDDRSWTSESRLRFIKNMLKAVATSADEMTISDKFTYRDTDSVKVDDSFLWPKHNPNLDVESLYPKILYARTHGKTEILKDFVNSLHSVPKFAIDKVIFNEPATIVMWKDGTKTVVKAENEPFDPEKGLAMAISKKALGNKREYYHTFIHWLKKYKPEEDV